MLFVFLGKVFCSQATLDLGAVNAIVAFRTCTTTMNPLISSACELGVHAVAVVI